MDNNKIEKRVNLDLDLSLEERSISENIDNIKYYKLEGRAIVFESASTYLTENGKKNFIEWINKEAITQEIINNSDIKFKINHKNSKILLRKFPNEVNPDFQIIKKDDGVYFTAIISDETEANRELIYQIQKKIIRSMSFAFFCDKDRWYKNSIGNLVREVKSISNVSDISPVFDPAYNSTSISATDLYTRGLKTIEEEENYKKENLSKYDSFLEKLNN